MTYGPLQAQIQGFTPGSVNLNSTPYGMQNYAPPQQQPQQSWLKTLLQFGAPIAGSLAGGALAGPPGFVAGGAGASALLNFLGGGRQGQNPLGAAEQDAMASLLGLGVGKVAGPLLGRLGANIFGKAAGEIAGEGGGQVTGDVAGESGGALGKLGSNIRGGVFKADVAKGAMQAPEQANLKNISEGIFGFKGSPAAISKQAGELASPSGLPSLVQQELAQNNAKVTAKQLTPLFEQNITKIPTYDPTVDTSFAKSLQTQLSKLTQAKDIQGIYDFKSSLPVAKIFPKLAAGGTLSQNEAAILVAHQTASDAIEQFGSPAIRTLNQLQNALNPIAVGAQKAASKSGGLFALGTRLPIPLGPIQATQDLIGRTAQAAGEAGQTTLGRNAGGIGATLGAGFGNIGSGQAQQNSPEQTMGQNDPQSYFAQQLKIPPEQVSPGGQWVQVNGQWIPNTTYAGSQFHQAELGQAGQSLDTSQAAETNPLQDPQKLVEMALQLAVSGNTKGSDQLLQIAQAMKSVGGEGNLTAAQQLRHDNLQTALSSLDAAQQNLITAGGAKGPFLGGPSTLPLLGQFTNPSGASYHATKIELATQLAKAITGGSRPGQQVIEYYMHSLPDVNEQPKFAQAKIDKIRNELMTQAKSFKFKDLVTNFQ